MEDEDVNTIAQLVILYELTWFIKQLFLYYFVLLYFILVGRRNR